MIEQEDARLVLNDKKMRRYIKKDKARSVSGSVITVAFQITFRAEMHANDVFSFFKNYF